jgi:hypothetical protein
MWVRLIERVLFADKLIHSRLADGFLHLYIDRPLAQLRLTPFRRNVEGQHIRGFLQARYFVVLLCPPTAYNFTTHYPSNPSPTLGRAQSALIHTTLPQLSAMSLRMAMAGAAQHP